MSELSPRYNSKEVEAKWYSLWEQKGYFRPKSDDPRFSAFRARNDKRPYVIVIPPPNVTGILHMGHALNNAIQDILIRFNRMRGKDTLWIPGTDHAGIATQNVVEKKLAGERKTRFDLGREKFLEEVWKWKDGHGSTITRQLRRLGASCDWSRERFTMDEGLSRAVREAFVTLYERGLIYQGYYIINWCPRCETALSDEEAAHKEVQGSLYHIKYPIVPSPYPVPSGERGRMRGEDHIVVATTRPETMLGDTAVAVHPDDPRYKQLIGKKVILPLMEREIPVIADEFVDPEFGTGIVKVTPAHDPNDFEMGRRHNLPQVNVMTPNGKINEHGGQYQGLDRFEARKRIIRDLEAQGLFVRRDSHLHAVGHCYRCDTVVEPYLSKQWFVKMKPLAEKALKAHREGKTKFYPDRWTKVYTNWLENIRDWCISRQIWWGHQIPVWYCDKCGKEGRGKREEGGGTKDEGRKTKGVIVSRAAPEKCPACGNAQLKQDPDVLDTWFSSWLWPFSTLGWPGKTEDLKYFYPTSDLITAPEIIFFWVARMIMAGLEFMGDVPFSRIYIHGTVRAQSGLKMSKSLGNAIDPIEVIDEIGADALRFSMIMLSAQDVYLSREKFEVGRNFTNKIWNAARFVLMNLRNFKEGSAQLDLDLEKMSLPNRWILSRLEKVTHEIAEMIDSFNLSQAATEVYHFVWNDFCDWFIELSKPNFDDAVKIQEETRAVLFYALERTLRLLHPFMPFISEEIWQLLRGMAQDSKHWPETLMLAPWPDSKRHHNDEAERSIERLQRAVGGIRDIRARLHIQHGAQLKAVIAGPDKKILETFEDFMPQFKVLARLEDLELSSDFKKTNAYLGTPFADFEVFIYIEGIVDPKKERERTEKKIEESENRIRSIRSRLANEDFVKKAPAELVQKERERLEDAQRVLKAHKGLLAMLAPHPPLSPEGRR